MAEPFLGEIRMFAGNFAPKGWAYCDGQLLPVSENDGLFSLLHTVYGGDGRTSFGLPDLRGRLALHFGQGPGLAKYDMGQRTGIEGVTVTNEQMPQHNHNFMGSSKESTDTLLNGKVFAKGLTNDAFYSSDASETTKLMPETIEYTGDSQKHPNIMPYLCIHYIIALVGIYPSRS
ncbi:MAG: phage tail protein [bacterium]|nr:phage tail protein [bacterium]